MIKKILLVASLVGAVAAAQAAEIGITDGNNYTKNENVWGVTVGTSLKSYTLTGGFARNSSADTFSITGAKDIAKFKSADIAVKTGVAYIDNKVDPDGYAFIVGVGASMPITKVVSATLDYSYQAGENKVSSQDGNRLTAGLKYRF